MVLVNDPVWLNFGLLKCCLLKAFNLWSSMSLRSHEKMIQSLVHSAFHLHFYLHFWNDDQLAAPPVKTNLNRISILKTPSLLLSHVNTCSGWAFTSLHVFFLCVRCLHCQNLLGSCVPNMACWLVRRQLQIFYFWFLCTESVRYCSGEGRPADGGCGNSAKCMFKCFIGGLWAVSGVCS